jgi:repressor LexA
MSQTAHNKKEGKMRSKNTAHYSTIVNFVNKYYDDIGRSPSTREIESGTGISRPTVQRYLRELCERGEIEYDGHRGIVTDYMRGATEGTSPVLMGNSIPCGMLNEVCDAELESIRMPTALIGKGDFFLLRARGNSMINAGIDDGDLVLIKRCETVREGRIAAFLFDNSETTLKRFKQDGKSIYLIPENDEMEPIVISGSDRQRLVIQGEAIMVMKDL